jgi:hypothetical protein
VKAADLTAHQQRDKAERKKVLDELHRGSREARPRVLARAMAFLVLYGALYPAPLRDVLVRLANTGVARATWSPAILDECSATFSKTAPN